MLEELIKNMEKYYWATNPDGDLVLGNSDLGLKAKVTFTLTNKWTNLAPIVEQSPGKYIGKQHTYPKKSKEYELVSELFKLVKAYLKEKPKINRDKVSKNTLNLLTNYYTG